MQPSTQDNSAFQPQNLVRANIALLMQDFSGGGAERMMVNIAEGLAYRGHEVEIVAVRPQGPFLARVPPIVRVVTLGPVRMSRSIPALVRYLRTRRPDAVLSSGALMSTAAVLARLASRIQTRLVLRQPGRIRESAQGSHPTHIRLAFRLLPRVYRRADHVIAISRGLADEVRDITGLGTDRVSAVHNPVLAKRDVAIIETVEPSPHPWLHDEGPPVMLSVGRLVPQKDHATLLEAFARLRRGQAARLIILGEGPLRNQLREHTQRLGIADDVVFAGFVDPPYVWMKRAALLVHTARWEGFCNVIVEALACGLPVVATDCPSGPAEILEGGRYGRLVPVGDVDTVARALNETLESRPPAESFRHRAADFTVEAVMPSYEAILLGRPSGSPAARRAGR